MIKSITITLLLAIIMSSCVITTQKNEIIVLNNTENIVEVDIYDTWSGETTDQWKLQKGINKFNIDGETLFGLYAKGFPEKTIYTHPNTTITFETNEVILDEINQEINAHYIWSQQIATGESQSIFHWHNSKENLKPLNDWEKLDSLLFKLSNNPEIKIEKGVLNREHINTYPAAYMLIDKICYSENISIAEKVNHLKTQLTRAELPNKTQNNFLKHYLMPQKLSLRNDSILIMANMLFPEISSDLNLKYKELEQTAILKKGMLLPDFMYENKTIKASYITNGYKYTLIDFWATWCIPCIKQMPDMNEFAKKYSNKIKFISLSVDNKRDYDKWKEIANEYKAIQHFWLSDTTTIREDFGIKGLPRMILLDHKGEIIDPNFPHFYDPLAPLWIKSLANKEEQDKVAKK